MRRPPSNALPWPAALPARTPRSPLSSAMSCSDSLLHMFLNAHSHNITNIPVYNYYSHTSEELWCCHQKHIRIPLNSSAKHLRHKSPTVHNPEAAVDELPFSAFQGLASHPAINDPIVSTTQPRPQQQQQQLNPQQPQKFQKPWDNSNRSV